MPGHIGNGFLEREEEIVPFLGIQNDFRQTGLHIQPAGQAKRLQQLLRVLAGIDGKRSDGVVARIHRPDDFIHALDQLAGASADFADILARFVFAQGGILRQVAGKADLRETGAQIVMQILGDPRPFAFELLLLVQQFQLAAQALGGNPPDRQRDGGEQGQQRGQQK